MTANTGRTVKRWVDVRIDDSGGTLRSIPVSSIGGVGLDYPEVELVAFQDAIKGVLLDTPEFETEISGPFDTTAAQTAGTLSGSHTILNGVNGGSTPLTFDVQIGIRHAWESGEPQFGITSSAANGVLVTGYQVNLEDMTYTAKIVMAAGSAAPAWGTAAET